MKNSVSQKCSYYISYIRKNVLKIIIRHLKVCLFLCNNTWLGLLLHGLLHQCGVAWRWSACGTLEATESPGCIDTLSSPYAAKPNSQRHFLIHSSQGWSYPCCILSYQIFFPLKFLWMCCIFFFLQLSDFLRLWILGFHFMIIKITRTLWVSNISCNGLIYYEFHFLNRVTKNVDVFSWHSNFLELLLNVIG